MPTPIWSIQADHVTRVDGEDFQDLCYALVDFEAAIRHRGAVVDGPPAQYVGDKGMDFRVEIKQEPKITLSDFARPLTVDRQSVTCIACKTGGNWRTGLLSDAKKQAPKEVIRDGGNFTMFVNRPLAPATERDPLVKQVTKALAASAGIQQSDLDGRIFLFDATDIAASYAHHPFWLPRPLEQQLGIQRVHGIGRVEDWRSWLQFSRSLPIFVADNLRHDAIQHRTYAVGFSRYKG